MNIPAITQYFKYRKVKVSSILKDTRLVYFTSFIISDYEFLCILSRLILLNPCMKSRGTDACLFLDPPLWTQIKAKFMPIDSLNHSRIYLFDQNSIIHQLASSTTYLTKLNPRQTDRRHNKHC